MKKSIIITMLTILMCCILCGCGKSEDEIADNIIASLNIALGEKSEESGEETSSTTDREFSIEKVREILESDDFKKASSSEKLLAYFEGITKKLAKEEESLAAELFKELENVDYKNDDLKQTLLNCCYSEDDPFVCKVKTSSLLSEMEYYTPEKITIEEIEQWIKENSESITMIRGYGGFYDDQKNYKSGDKYRGWSIIQNEYQYFGDFSIKSEHADTVSEFDYSLTHSEHKDLYFRGCVLSGLNTIKSFAYAPPYLFSNNGSIIQVYSVKENENAEHMLDIEISGEKTEESLWTTEQSEPTEEQKKKHEEYTLLQTLEEMKKENKPLEDIISVLSELAVLNDEYQGLLDKCKNVEEYSGTYQSYKRVVNNYTHKEEAWDSDKIVLDFCLKGEDLAATIAISGKNIVSETYDDLAFSNTENGFELVFDITYNGKAYIKQTLRIQDGELLLEDARPNSYTVYYEKSDD